MIDFVNLGGVYVTFLPENVFSILGKWLTRSRFDSTPISFGHIVKESSNVHSRVCQLLSYGLFICESMQKGWVTASISGMSRHSCCWCGCHIKMVGTGHKGLRELTTSALQQRTSSIALNRLHKLTSAKGALKVGLIAFAVSNIFNNR